MESENGPYGERGGDAEHSCCGGGGGGRRGRGRGRGGGGRRDEALQGRGGRERRRRAKGSVRSTWRSNSRAGLTEDSGGRGGGAPVRSRDAATRCQNSGGGGQQLVGCGGASCGASQLPQSRCADPAAFRCCVRRNIHVVFVETSMSVVHAEGGQRFRTTTAPWCECDLGKGSNVRKVNFLSPTASPVRAHLAPVQSSKVGSFWS